MYKVGIDIFLKENKCPTHSVSLSKRQDENKQRPSQTDYDNLAKWVQPYNHIQKYNSMYKMTSIMLQAMARGKLLAHNLTSGKK